MRDQYEFFPELDPYLTKVKNIDYIDIVKVKCGKLKKTPYTIVPEGMYILFKSGGFNKYHPKMGNVFPYIQNTKTSHILSVTTTEYSGYAKCNITLPRPSKKGILIFMHRIVSEAFIENDMPDKKNNVDHINGDSLDYRVENLRWLTSSQNAKNRKIKSTTKKQMTVIEKARMEKAQIEKLK
tara:strand:+ start:42 stop:587 length:546 start_codon:yes stop_codon:yes gene_type:complete